MSGPCPGLPTSGLPAAWAVNVTVTSAYTADGGLKGWGYVYPEPNASIINWQAGQSGAIANGVVLKSCSVCQAEINVKAFGDATHVIIDVMGYFELAAVGDATMTRLAGTTLNLAISQQAAAFGGDCPAGTLLVSGEVSVSNYSMNTSDNRQSPYSATQWMFTVENRSGSSATATAYSRCMDTPIHN